MVRSTTTTSTKSSSSKPYDRLTTKTKDKANAKAPHGAPSQLSQSSRKGKKAWRKNVDVSLEEEALEHAREEERVTG